MRSLASLIFDLDCAVQRAADTAFRRVPAPWGFARLAPLRAEAAREVLARRAPEVERARALFEAGGEGLDGEGARAVVQIGDELLAEMRRAVVARAAQEGLLGAVARLDQRLPTDRMEHVDDPTFPERRRTAAIRSLDRLNRALGSYVRFLTALTPLLDGGCTSVLDVASGRGGFALSLARLARQRGIRLRIIASDIRPEYVALGRQRAEALGERDVEFRVVDAFRLGDAFAPGEIDVITCTQTLHHFGAGLTAALVGSALRHARRGLLFIDTTRTVSSLVAVGTAAILGSADPAQIHDGTVSIRKSFVPEELWLLAQCVPRGGSLSAFFMGPGHAVLRSDLAQRAR